MRGKRERRFAAVLAVVLLAAGLSGCGAPVRARRAAEESSWEKSAAVSTLAGFSPGGGQRNRADKSAENPGGRIELLKSGADAQISIQSENSGGNMSAGIEDTKKEKADESKKTSSSSRPTEKQKAGPTAAEIARISDLGAQVETHRSACFVDVDRGENPYDVTWDYGELYETYIKSVDWELLFDADYYQKTFPALALLYHNDKQLLLRHFQTVGIHEGRQGRESFYVAAYMKNCGSQVKEAFGDSYACYYFYYALNYAAEKKVNTAGAGEKKQLTVKLTSMQQTELKNVNEYRSEVGLGPLKFDPELAAFACYRAYIDALEDWDAHDWLKARESELDRMMEMIETYRWGENTVHGYSRFRDESLIRQATSAAWYINYRYSPDHYEAMINGEYHYFGSANAYISDYEKENPRHPNVESVYVHFDLFTDSLTTPLHG